MHARASQNPVPWPDIGHPPENLSQRQKIFHEILKLAAMGITINYYRLLENIKRMEFFPKEKPDGMCHESVIWTDVLSVVDNCKRMLVAIDNYPGLRRSFFSPFREQFRASEEFRNHYQHLEQMCDPNYVKLAWGALSWVVTFSNSPTGFSVNTMLPGYMPSNLGEVKGPPYPFFSMPPRTVPIGLAKLSLGEERYLDLTELTDSVPEIVRGYKTSLADIREDKFVT